MEAAETPPTQVKVNTTTTAPLLTKKPLTCPTCHQPVKGSDYFCPNCGKNLKPTPPSTTVGSMIALFVKSALLPPMGIIWGIRYLKYKDPRSKFSGLIAIVITVLIIVIATLFTINTINTVNEQVNDQLQKMMF